MELRVDVRKQRGPSQEVGHRLRVRGRRLGAVHRDYAPRTRTSRVRGLSELNVGENRWWSVASCRIACPRCLAGLDAPGQQAAKPGGEQAGRTECPGLLERRECP